MKDGRYGKEDETGEEEGERSRKKKVEYGNICFYSVLDGIWILEHLGCILMGNCVLGITFEHTKPREWTCKVEKGGQEKLNEGESLRTQFRKD